MIYEVADGEISTRVELRKVDENVYDVIIDGDTVQADLLEGSATILSLIENGAQFECVVERGRNGTVDVLVSGRSFNFTVNDGRAKSLTAPADNISAGPQRVVAEMPGRVLKVDVDLGSKVADGQVIMAIEAMKMENPIVSPKAGVILEMNVKAGDAVEPGSPLFLIGAASEQTT